MTSSGPVGKRRRATGRVPLGDGLELYGGTLDGVWIVAEVDGPVVAALYRAEGAPGWWRGHYRGRVRQLYLPQAEPIDAARRFLAS